MKNLFIVLVIVTVSLVSCEKRSVEEEINTLELNPNEIIAVDREDIERPGDQG